MITVKSPTTEIPCDSGNGDIVTLSLVATEYTVQRAKNCGIVDGVMTVCIWAEQDVIDAIKADNRFEVVE